MGHVVPEVLGERSIADGRPQGGRFPCQKRSAEYVCYGPRQVRAAYRFAPLIRKGDDGTGETIVIIDPFQDPTIEHDLALFDSTFKLSAPPSFEVVAPFGLTPFEASNEEELGTAEEIAIDVEWSHAIAPGAKIVLALAPSNADENMVAVERYVVDHDLGDVVSMSYIETEGCESPSLQEEEHAVYREGVEHGMTFVAGAGDWGAASFNCEFTAANSHPAVGVPASDPDVTSVGGTMLKADLYTGTYRSESVWNEVQSGWPELAAGGGGFSSIYPAPPYQKGIPAISTQRGVPDVAYGAAAHGGFLVATTTGFYPEDPIDFHYGTSCGAPQWAGLVAIADQLAGRQLGNINPALYEIAEGADYHKTFHDITEGNNSYAPVTGYTAAPGWDPASGWGSPIAARLVPLLAASTAASGDQATRLSSAPAPAKRGASAHRFRALAR